MKVLKKQVALILIRYKKTRNCDKLLYTKLCKTFYKNDTIETETSTYINTERTPKASDVERFRRWYNNRGMYLPTDLRVIEQRCTHSKTMRRYF
jgi:hypothetical protein